MSKPSTVEIELDYPLEDVSPHVKALTLRRPKVRDQIAASKASKDPVEQEVTLFVALCEVPRDTIESLDMSDYLKLQKAYEAMNEAAGNG